MRFRNKFNNFYNFYSSFIQQSKEEMITHQENQQLSLQITESPRKYSMDQIQDISTYRQYATILKEKFFTSRIQEEESNVKVHQQLAVENLTSQNIEVIKRPTNQEIYMTPKNIKESKRKYLQLFSTNNTKRQENDDRSEEMNHLRTHINKPVEIEQIMFNEIEIKPEIHSPEHSSLKESHLVVYDNMFAEIEHEEKIIFNAQTERSTFQFSFSDPKSLVELVKPQQNIIVQSSVKSRRKKKINITNKLPQKTKEKFLCSEVKINECFRYCIGCQKAILQGNIIFHEKQCEPYQKVFVLSEQELIQYTKNKIKNLKNQVESMKNALTDKELLNLKQKVQDLLQESIILNEKGLLNDNYHVEYSKTQEASIIWSTLIEKINKFNWFLKLLQRMEKQFYQL